MVREMKIAKRRHSGDIEDSDSTDVTISVAARRVQAFAKTKAFKDEHVCTTARGDKDV